MANTSPPPDVSFVRADSRNLPKLEMVMILEYMAVNNNHNIAEIRGAKMLMSSRDAYVNTAVGYVEVKRETGICSVKAKIVPEHRIGSKLYNVTAKIEETQEIITEAICEDCAAAAGGCKHSMLLLFSLEKRSSEASTTSVQCYWAKPKLSSARFEHVQSKAIFKNAKKIKLDDKDPDLMSDFREECERRMIKDSLITCFNKNKDDVVNIFDMAINFVEEETQHEFQNFMQYANIKIHKQLKENISEKTLDQANNKFWHYVRQGRLTASKLREAAHCTTDGVLVQQILGGYKIPETAAINRGKRLEAEVIKKIEKKLKTNIKKCGFLLINPILGASPDGLGTDFVIEVKCPMTKKTFNTYIKDGKMAKKFVAQIYCQMLAANKPKGLFCVADPTFEETKKIHLLWAKYNQSVMNELIEKAAKFWEKYIYPKIIRSVKE